MASPTTGTSSTSARARSVARRWCASRRPRSRRAGASRPRTSGSGPTRTSSRWRASPASWRRRAPCPAIQLAHAGRKASTTRPWDGDRPLADADGGWEPVAPSALPFNAGWRMPHALGVDEIGEVVGHFRDAAVRAREAGFEWLELHARPRLPAARVPLAAGQPARRRLGRQLRRPLRASLVEVVRAVRRVWPERLPLALRLSCTDWVEGGWTLEDSVALPPRLKDEGVDLIDCSSGGIVAARQDPGGARLPGAASPRPSARPASSPPPSA